jgi:hypothetical protein
MAYIGREPQIGNFQVCDAISTVNGQAAYTMQVSSVNVSPETANHMLVSLNGVLQAPGSSYTVSGSTITFASNLVTGDVINFIHILGSVLDLGVPSDATVSTAKIVDDAITLAKMAPGTDGNLITYDASGNPVAVATGSSGQVLTSAGAGAVPSFQSPAGGGKVLQVVTGVDNGENETTSTSFAATNLSVAITPSATSSKVFVIASGVLDNKSSGRYMYATLYRDSTNLAVGNEGMIHHYGDGTRLISSGNMSILDSPSSTSEITYKVYIRTTSGQVRFGQNSTRQTITAFEIGA